MTLVKVNFSRVSAPAFLADARHIHFSMTNNSNFPDPEPGLDELQECIDEYSAALDNMGNGMGATLIRDDKRKKLQKKLKILGYYVEKIAGDNRIIAESSGFKLRSKWCRIGILEKGSNLRATPGPVKGSIKLRINKIRGARIYQFEYKLSSDNSNDNWKVATATKTSVIISGLISGQEYAFRVAGIGTNPVRVYSDEVRSFVL
ncbi:MAG: fibronectin type III domain-containing protein [Daejeonella sp.]